MFSILDFIIENIKVEIIMSTCDLIMVHVNKITLHAYISWMLL